MEILSFKKTTDADLSKGQKVAYKDKAGEYTLTAVIDNIYTDQDGTTLYQMNVGASYMADELKLIKEDNKICNTYKELTQQVMEKGSFVEVTYELFEEALCVLPPVWLKNGCFQVGEEHSVGMSHTFGKKDGKYYGCLCNKNFALNNF